MTEFTGESPIFRTGYNYDTEHVSRQTALACPQDEGMTQQNHRDEADINTIVRRFGLTGELPMPRDTAEWGDFTHATDYHTAMNAVKAAEQRFMELPADLRAKFDHNAGKLLDFLNDDTNRAAAEEMGLVPKKQTVVHSAPATTAATTEGTK